MLLGRQDDNATLLKLLLDIPNLFDSVHASLVASIHEGIRAEAN